MKKLLKSPALLIILTVLSTILVAGFIYLEYQARQQDYIRLLEKQAALFIGALSKSTTSAIEEAAQVENLLNDQLYKSLRLVDQLTDRRTPGKQEMNSWLSLLDVQALYVYGRQGSVEASAVREQIDPLPGAIVQARLRSADTDTIIPFYGDKNPEKEWLAAVVAREQGGLVVAMIGKERINTFRRLYGVGQFLKQFQSDDKVEYILIQNSQTIVAGSFKNYALSTFSKDPLLNQVLRSDRVRTRIVSYPDHQIFETISPFHLEDQPFGVLRLGLSMQEYERLQKDMHRRLYIFLIVVFVFALISGNLMQNYRQRVQLSHHLGHMQMYTDTLLDHLMSGVISIAPDGNVQSINQHALRLLNKSSAQVLSQPYSVLPAAIREHIASLIQQDIKTDAADRLWIEDESGPRQLLSVRSSRIPAQAGGKTTIILIDDITDQTRLEEQLQRNQRLTAMRNLASSVAHEIRNPLNSIKLIVDLFRKKYKAPSEMAALTRQLDTASSEIDRISAIIDQYLKFARLPVPHRIPVQLPTLADEVATLFAESLRHQQIELQVSFEPHPTLVADPDQIRQVFINLLKNAEEAISGSGRISFTGRVTSACYEIRVIDSGKGIADKDRSFIFDFHFTTKKEGSGIGLSMVQHIMNAHGGDVQVVSAPGEGAVFILHLPMADLATAKPFTTQPEGV